MQVVVVVLPGGTSSWYVLVVQCFKSDAIATGLIHGHVKAYFSDMQLPQQTRGVGQMLGQRRRRWPNI